MDGFVLGLFLFAAFLGGFASGLAGFAMGFVVSGIWLHIITPIQTAALTPAPAPPTRTQPPPVPCNLRDARASHSIGPKSTPAPQ